MKILVTGASGFLGGFLTDYLTAAGHEVTGLSSKTCDLRKDSSLEAFSGTRYDQIYHLAAWTQAGDFCLTHAGEQWLINQQINTHVLRWWHERQNQAKMMIMGTSCAYAPGSLHKEEDYMVGEPIDSLYTYAMTKRMLLQGVRAFHKQFGYSYLCTVPSTLYGPRYHTDGRQMHFIFDLIRKIIRAKEFGEPVTLWGDGYQKREIVYVEDYVKTLCRLAGAVDNDIVNIGSGRDYTIREFAGFICDVVGYDPELIGYDTDRYVGAKSKILSSEKVAGLCPGYLETDIVTGLRKTIEWFYAEEAYKL